MFQLSYMGDDLWVKFHCEKRKALGPDLHARMMLFGGWSSNQKNKLKLQQFDNSGFSHYGKTSLKILKDPGKLWQGVGFAYHVLVFCSWGFLVSVFFLDANMSCDHHGFSKVSRICNHRYKIHVKSAATSPPSGWSTQRKMSQFVGRKLGAQRSWKTGCCCWDGNKNGFGKSYTEWKIIMASQPTPP